MVRSIVPHLVCYNLLLNISKGATELKMAVHVAACIIQLNLAGVRSLKEKRRIVKSILSRLSREFNVAVAEVDAQDTWHTAVVALAAIGNDPAYLHGMLEKSVAWIERVRPDTPVDSYTIEFY